MGLHRLKAGCRGMEEWRSTWSPADCRPFHFEAVLSSVLSCWGCSIVRSDRPISLCSACTSALSLHRWIHRDYIRYVCGSLLVLPRTAHCDVASLRLLSCTLASSQHHQYSTSGDLIHLSFATTSLQHSTLRATASIARVSTRLTPIASGPVLLSPSIVLASYVSQQQASEQGHQVL